MIYNKVIVFERRMFDMVFDVIDLKEIKSMFTNPVYQRGLKYFQDGRVKDLFHDQVRDCWYAKVSGSKSYQVEYGKQEKKFLVNAVAQHLINIGNPAVEEQAAGRAHRMGQKKVVQVIRM